MSAKEPPAPRSRSPTYSLASIDSLIDGTANHNINEDGPLGLEQDIEAQKERHYTASNDVLASRIQSALSTKSKRVPVKQRRGLLSWITVIPEYEDARDYPDKLKAVLVFIIAFVATTGPMGTSILMPAIDDVVKDLETSVAIVNVSVGVYLLALGIFPMWWSTFSERFGRRSIYIISFTLFCCFSIGAALSPTVQALIGFRVLCGMASSSVQAVGAGTVGDLYSQHERGRAMGVFYLGPLMGPFLAPILGGAVAQAWGWRATQWLLVIFSGCSAVFVIFGLPETLRTQDSLTAVRDMLAKRNEEETSTDQEIETGIPANITNTPGNHDVVDKQLLRNISRMSEELSRHQSLNVDHDAFDDAVTDTVMPTLTRLTTSRSTYSRRIAQEVYQDKLERISNTHNSSIALADHEKMTWKDVQTATYDVLIRPLHALVLLTYPPVFLVITYSAISFAVVYFFNMTITYEYGRPPYNFSTIIVGLMYIPNSVTYVMASIIGGRWNDKLLRDYADKHDGELVPESRISWNVVVAVVLFFPACLIFGWCLRYGEHWVTPLIGTAIFGFASMLIIGTTVTYLVDTLPGKGATGVALNNLCRQILAAIATFVVEPALSTIGPGILLSILLGIMTLAAVTLVYLKRNGQYFREHYDLAKYYDKL
ncbi:hypothetical protein QFC19_009315 [Naganishia cerealis]|uniref:Uncharacterized protein n=1 Tax=Naganishia cerealis TaxID=610337 RepID=A0ACC2UV85_9TREE|nr:hypothetical protein QFC19_009315 [Naganishia cerealis]